MTLQPPQPSRHRTTDSKERNYQQIRVRQDTNENWLKNDPIPASGEWCYSIGTPGVDTLDPSQRVKIGDGTTPWSNLPWQGGRGPTGNKGDKGDGFRFIGILDDCGEPTESDYPPNYEPQLGDVWMVQCADRSNTSDCIINECDGDLWYWDSTQWVSMGNVQGPPGNNVEYYYQEFAAEAGQTKFQLDNEVQVQATFVTINGVILLPNDYTLANSGGSCELEFFNDIPLKDEDIIMVFSFKGAIDAAVRTLTTADISTLGVRPQGVSAVPREDMRNQQQVNWYLLDAIDNIEIPEAIDLPDNIATTDDITAAVAGLATEEWVTNQIDNVEIPSVEGLTTKDYVDNQDQVVQEWVENKNYLIDEGQNTQIDTLENKVKALEGTVVEAQYKADARDEPQIGSFVLKNMLNEKVLQFNQATYIILSETDFTNKPIDASKVMAGDIVRLVMSPSNYANFTVTSVANRNGNINLEVTFGSAGPEGIVFDGAVYDFTHTTPFDIGAACTKQYSDDQDAVTLKAAQDYADALDIPDAVVTDSFLSDEGEQHIKPEWKIRDPNKAYTYITIAPSGGMGLYHLKTPEASHHAVPVSYLEDVCFNSITNTLNLRSEESDHVKISCSDSNDWAPQNNEKNILRGNYKSNGGSLSEWSFGFNQHNQYWQYDWDMGNSNCCMTWHVKGDKKFTIDTSGAKMANAYIVRDTDFSGVAEEDYEAVSEAAVEIDIGHRLRELKKILVNLKTALTTKSADAQQALLDVLENVEDI